jgi:predicted MPP superfamily phosphohydrolase
VGTIRIAQISDVHLGLIVRENRLKSILSKVKEEEPDILISTGDLVDGQLNDLDGLIKLFKEIKPRFGKYAVTGNHEFYAGLAQALDFTRKAGFIVLRGEKITIEGILNIAGVDDKTRTYYNENVVSERELLMHLPRNIFTIFLKHRPIVNKDITGLFDLQLSGHVHKGQIFPFSVITGLYYETQAGFAKLPSEASLYVSRGSGTWGPPIRFLSSPEVAIIDLVPTGDNR